MGALRKCHIVKQSGDEKINAPVYNETCINRRVVTPVINTSGQKSQGGEKYSQSASRGIFSRRL